MSKILYGADEVNALKKAEQASIAERLGRNLSRLVKKQIPQVSYPKQNYTSIWFALDEVSKQHQEITSLSMTVYRVDGTQFTSYPDVGHYDSVFTLQNVDWDSINHIILTIFGKEQKNSPSFGVVIITAKDINSNVSCYRVE
jgi:hypothetical protein